MSETEHNLEDARKLLRQMEAAAATMPQQTAVRVQHRQFERRLAELERALLTAMPRSHAVGGDAFVETYARAERTAKSLERTEAAAYESEQIGAAIMTDLHGQRERLEAVDGKLGAVDAVMDRTRGKLRRLYWRVVSDRTILRIVIAVEVVTIVCIVFFRWILPLIP